MNNWLLEVEARAKAATPGPWNSHTEVTYNLSGEDMLRGACEHKYAPDSYVGKGHFPVSEQADKDAKFIAHARTDIPELIRRLRIAEEALQAYYISTGAHWADKALAAIRKDP